MKLGWLCVSALAVGIIGVSACGEDEVESEAGNGSGDAGTAGAGAVAFDVDITADYPANGCVAEKQVAAGRYCHDVFQAWARWESSGDDAARDADIAGALSDLEAAWEASETLASDEGSDCSDRALTAAQAADRIDESVTTTVDAIHAELEPDSDPACGAGAMSAAAQACGQALIAEALHVADPGSDADRSALTEGRAAAFGDFSDAWQEATSGGCAAASLEESVLEGIEGIVDALVADTIVAVGLDDTEFTTISPTGTTRYQGKDLTPMCMDGSPYHFFVKRGTINKVLMYYQGGGACWEELTCSLQTCDTSVEPTGGDNPNNRNEGFADRTNPDNPFRDWHQVFVSYCSCDIHFGDAAQDYPTHVEHRGFHNAQYAEKWAREHFVNPEVVFVTGSSAGSYGALFNGALLHNTWPASQFHILGDAGNGVITSDFLNNELSNWNFVANLPEDVPGVLEALEGGGMVAYLEAVANHYPATNWANYSTMYDGGAGGQTGFYNVMLNGNDPAAALTWWEGSCAFGSQMRAQAVEAYERASENYRYYIGTGSRHTMWGHDKVYGDTTGGVPTVVDWIDAMLRSGPDGRDPEWSNVECTNCGLTLAGDPVPDPLETPFEQQGSDIVIACP